MTYTGAVDKDLHKHYNQLEYTNEQVKKSKEADGSSGWKC